MSLNNRIVEEILGIALSGGADFAEIFWENTRNGNVVLLDGKIDAITDSTVTGAGIRAFIGTRTVYASTSDTGTGAGTGLRNNWVRPAPVPTGRRAR